MATFREEPYGDFNFMISIHGISEGDEIAAGFSEVSGLGVAVEPIEYRNGNEDITVRKLPGLKKFTNITLKRGVVGDLAFWEWVKAAMDGAVQRADVTISLLDESRAEAVLQWRVRRAWPCRYEGPSLRAGSSDVALETLELCHEGLELV
jgi:phage tail-like protein